MFYPGSVAHGAEWSMPVRQPSGFRVFARANGGGNALGPPPSLAQNFEICGLAAAA